MRCKHGETLYNKILGKIRGPGEILTFIAAGCGVIVRGLGHPVTFLLWTSPASSTYPPRSELRVLGKLAKSRPHATLAA